MNECVTVHSLTNHCHCAVPSRDSRNYQSQRQQDIGKHTPIYWERLGSTDGRVLSLIRNTILQCKLRKDRGDVWHVVGHHKTEQSYKCWLGSETNLRRDTGACHHQPVSHCPLQESAAPLARAASAHQGPACAHWQWQPSAYWMWRGHCRQQPHRYRPLCHDQGVAHAEDC